LARLSAALVAACLLLTFAACLFVCSEHVEEAHGGSADVAMAEACATHCAAPCAVTEATAFVPSKRFDLDRQAAAAQAAAAPAAQEPAHVAPLAGRYAQAPKAPDPPFERLRALRI